MTRCIAVLVERATADCLVYPLGVNSSRLLAGLAGREVVSHAEGNKLWCEAVGGKAEPFLVLVINAHVDARVDGEVHASPERDQVVGQICCRLILWIRRRIGRREVEDATPVHRLYIGGQALHTPRPKNVASAEFISALVNDRVGIVELMEIE